MADDGGSTGILREEFGILPPGDVRRVLVALSRTDKKFLSRLFNYRFLEGGLAGHTFGNIMLTALERLTGSFEKAIGEASKILGAEGVVLPVTLDNVRLVAELENGSIIHGETNIDIPRHDPQLRIVSVRLEPRADVNPKAREAIETADVVVIGPGDLYTSIIPNLLVRGVRESLEKSRAKKIYVVNIMTKLGETNGFAAADFISSIETYTGKRTLDYALINTKQPSMKRLKRYEKESAEFVIPGNLRKAPIPIMGNFLRDRTLIRHDPDRVAQQLIALLPIKPTDYSHIG